MPSRLCAHCRVVSGMTGLTEPHATSDDARTAAYRCDNCLHISSAIHRGGINMASGTWKGTFHADNALLEWHPSALGGREYVDVPVEIAAAADEAHRVRTINGIRGAMMLARAVVEATAKEQGVTNGRLLDKIDKLADQGLIRAATKHAAHEVRHAGNDMAHGDFGDSPEPADADDLLTIMDEILEEVYEGPGRVARLRQKRENRQA